MHRFFRSFRSVMVSFLILLLTPSFAGAVTFVTTDGGLKVAGKDETDFWFQIGGIIKVDQRVYWGDTEATRGSPIKAGTYDSGAFVRDVGLTFEGGLGKDYTYNLALNFDPSASLSRVDDAYVTYHGFKNCLPNFTFDIGQVIPGFCLTCAASSKWIPFLERSMGTNTFGPQQGLGINFTSFNDYYTTSVTLTQQPKTGIPVVDAQNNIIPKPDLWQAALRFNYRPIYGAGRVLQFGVSFDIEELSNTGLRYRPDPEMKSGTGSTISLLDTAVPILNSTGFPTASPANQRGNMMLISAKNKKVIDFELLFIKGPWSGEVEYQRAYIARGINTAIINNNVTQGPNLQFSGYHAQISYVLTGEFRPLKISNATLGQIIPRCKYGAFEVSARYSFISLNDQDINGGLAHNTGVSLCWYINRNLKAIGEYIYSQQHRYITAYTGSPAYKDLRHVESIGARLQAVF